MKINNLSVLAYANMFTLWHYRSDDDVFTDGYFNASASMIKTGDMVFLNGPKTGLFLFKSDEEKASIHPIASTEGEKDA